MNMSMGVVATGHGNKTRRKRGKRPMKTVAIIDPPKVRAVKTRSPGVDAFNGADIPTFQANSMNIGWIR